MASYELIYEADEDVLEVTFDVVDENFSRAIALNQEIVIHTDSQMATAWLASLRRWPRLLALHAGAGGSDGGGEILPGRLGLWLLARR